VTVEIVNVSVTKRRVDLGLVQGGRLVRGEAGERDRARARPPRERAPAPSPEPVIQASPRAGLARRKAAGRAVERAVSSRPEPGATPRRGGFKLKVSHRGPGRDRDGDGGGDGSAKPRKGAKRPRR